MINEQLWKHLFLVSDFTAKSMLMSVSVNYSSISFSFLEILLY